MAIIALSGTTFKYSAGLGAFDALNTALTSAQRSTSSLQDVLVTLKLKIDIASAFTSVETIQEQIQKAESREAAKASALSLAYEKLDALIMDTAVVDQKVADVINSLEADFY